MLRHALKYAFVCLVAWPVMRIWLGLKVRHRERLPRRGPAIVAANHNSHLDTLALLALFPLSVIRQVCPVAAADYFMRSTVMTWFSRHVVDVIAVQRKRGDNENDPLEECEAALRRGEILIIYPEGTRGEPEKMAELRFGIACLAERCTDVPVVTVFMHGLGRSMPKGSVFPRPLVADVVLGDPFSWTGSRLSFMEKLQKKFDALRAELSAEAARGA